MNVKSKVLIGLMALSLAGTIGGVFALTRNAASKTGSSGAYDKAIYLFWDHEQTEKTIANVTNLTNGVAQYRYLTVAPKSTKGVAGNVQLTFTLALAGANTHMNGLTVSVFRTASLANDETVAGLINEVVAEPVLNSANASGTTNFAISARDAEHAENFEDFAYYAIKVEWNGSNDPEHPTYTMGANLTIAQNFVA